ncbi:hypothetical protein ACHQM5_000738 [Ranunculus cassubicifolius]
MAARSCLYPTLLVFYFMFLTCFPLPAHSSPTYIQGQLPLGVVGPESFAFDCYGDGPYTGVADGRIFKYTPGGSWSEFGFTTPYRLRRLCDGSMDPNREFICGRPLGLKFDQLTCDLIVADAYHGLVKIPSTGGHATTLASSAEGVPFKFLNSLAVDSDNQIVYFTESSTNFQRKDFLKVYNSGDRTGRLMSYNLITKQVTVFLRQIKYANGIALSKDKDYLLVSEIGNKQILRYWLQGPKANTAEVFTKLRDAPDNINLNDDGSYWVALNNGRPEGVHTFRNEVIGVKINRDGNIVQPLQGDGLIQSVSEVKEYDGNLLIGTIGMPYIGITSG